MKIRKLLSRLEKTPFHPQWFALRGEASGLREICSGLEGLVADIGCAESRPKDFLAAGADYLGIDYYTTAVGWYGTKPHLYADAQRLPIVDNSIDHALLLDVLEHLPYPDQCLAEVYRVLKTGGSLTIQVPFLYPVHDAPLDFHRWTKFGLFTAAEKHGYSVEKERVLGHPLESAALNANIALSQTVLNWLRNRNILGMTAILLPLLVFLINILAWVGTRLSKPDPLMPYGYRMVWTKD